MLTDWYRLHECFILLIELGFFSLKDEWLFLFLLLLSFSWLLEIKDIDFNCRWNKPIVGFDWYMIFSDGTERRSSFLIIWAWSSMNNQNYALKEANNICVYKKITKFFKQLPFLMTYCILVAETEWENIMENDKWRNLGNFGSLILCVCLCAWYFALCLEANESLIYFISKISQVFIFMGANWKQW